MKLSLVKRSTRVLVCVVLLSVMLSACLYLYHTAFPFLHDRLTETEKDFTAWVVTQLSFSLPFILICLFLAVAYRGTDRHDGLASREKQWIVILLAVFAYAILRTYVSHVSEEMYRAAAAAAEAAGTKPLETDGGVPLTLMLKSREWFIRLAIPLGLLILFYGVRAAREKDAPDEVEEPVYVTDNGDLSADMPVEVISEEVQNG